jgi:hypothetical protein
MMLFLLPNAKCNTRTDDMNEEKGGVNARRAKKKENKKIKK